MRTVDTAETHVSWVFFLGRRAYKLKKPVKLGFLDFSTVERRRAACEREVELNRRLAPDVYRGVATILDEHGRPCDHLVVMERMPDDRRLALAPTAECVGAVARKMAEFHEGAVHSAEIDGLGTTAAVWEKWDANTHELRRLCHGVDAVAVEHIHALAHRYLVGRRALFEARIADGCIVDGHGDLLADDVFCLDDGPRILDCLEFDDRLRWGDQLADIAFLAMDLERLGGPDLSELLLAEYGDAAGDSWPDSLAHHYIAHRAQIRAKVAALQEMPERVTALLGLARRHLEEGAVRLVLVGGLPGTGKTALATALAARLGYTLIRSDVVRAGPDYSPGAVAANYRVMLELAADAMGMGESVVLDATWSDAARRCEARHLAASAEADVYELECTAPADLAARRIAERVADESDATAAVAADMASRFEDWPQATVIDTARALDEEVADAAKAVGSAC